MAYCSGGSDGKSIKIFKLQKKVMRLISNFRKDASYRVLFKILNILPLPCMYIMEIVCYIKMNIEGLEQNSGRHNYNTRHRSDLQCKFCRTDILEKSINNMGVKLYNKLSNHSKNLENIQLFKKETEIFPIATDLLFRR
jgi:hypothetical protein